MELRTYGAILRRRLWIIVLVVGVVALYSAYQYYALAKKPGALKANLSSVTIQVGLQANAHSTDQFYSDYMTTSEALADELTTGPILTSKEFTTQVSRQIQADMGSITQRYGAHADLGPWHDSSAIGAALSASRVRSLVTVNVTWSTPAGAWALANAVGEVSASQIGSYLDYEVRNAPTFSQDAHPQVTAKVISMASDPSPTAGPSANKATLLLVLLLVACVVAIALAFLVEYLDDRIYSREAAVQLLQLPVYGEVPRAPSVAAHPKGRRAH